MVRVLKLPTPHQVKRMKRNKHLLLCEAPKYAISGRMELHPCVLQDIGLLGPLPCFYLVTYTILQNRATGIAYHILLGCFTLQKLLISFHPLYLMWSGQFQNPYHFSFPQNHSSSVHLASFLSDLICIMQWDKLLR